MTYNYVHVAHEVMRRPALEINHVLHPGQTGTRLHEFRTSCDAADTEITHCHLYTIMVLHFARGGVE